MKKSYASQEKRIYMPGFDRTGLETTEAPLKPKEATGRAADKVDSQPPIEPVLNRFPALEEQEIALTFFAPEAGQVHVAGDFNSWRPDAAPLKNLGDGNWIVRLMLRSGQYEYRFVVDGRWSEDPEASQRVANSFGGFNSILMVPLADRTYIL